MEAAILAVDANTQRYAFRPEEVQWTSATFWDKYTLAVDRWVDCLVTLTRGCRVTAMSLILQTPIMACPHGEWAALVRLPKQDIYTMVTIKDVIVPRPSETFGYEVDAALTHAAMCFGQGVALPGDVLGLYVTDPTPAVRRWFRRLFVQTAPDDRLVQEAWQPNVHPVVTRGLALLHRLTGGGTSDVLDRLLSMEVRCTTPEQDALVTQCRRAAGIVDIHRPMKRLEVTVESHMGEWDFKWDNVPVQFLGNERVYERSDERLRWVAIWITCSFSSDPGFRNVLQRTPDALLTVLLPAIKRTLKKSPHHHGNQTPTTTRLERPDQPRQPRQRPRQPRRRQRRRSTEETSQTRRRRP